MADLIHDVAVELIWAQDLRFGATTGDNGLVIDGRSAAGPSPVQLLALGLAGCMATDVVDVLVKGHHPLEGLRVTLVGERAPEPPRRLTRVAMTFHVRGAVPSHAVDRAVALSRDKYCSVWHSLRQDIELTTIAEIHP